MAAVTRSTTTVPYVVTTYVPEEVIQCSSDENLKYIFELHFLRDNSWFVKSAFGHTKVEFLLKHGWMRIPMTFPETPETKELLEKEDAKAEKLLPKFSDVADCITNLGIKLLEEPLVRDPFGFTDVHQRIPCPKKVHERVLEMKQKKVVSEDINEEQQILRFKLNEQGMTCKLIDGGDEEVEKESELVKGIEMSKDQILRYKEYFLGNAEKSMSILKDKWKEHDIEEAELREFEE